MVDPIRLSAGICSPAETPDRPEIGDIIATHVSCSGIAFQVAGQVIELIRSDDGETAIIIDHVGAGWEVPIDCATVQRRAA